MNDVFIYLMKKHRMLCEAGLEDTEEASLIFMEAMDYAPEEFKSMAHDMAVKIGLIPPTPDGYTDEGEPMYDMPAMAKRLGIDLDDIPERFKASAYQGRVHRAH
jgi:hypothetical protein